MTTWIWATVGMLCTAVAFALMLFWRAAAIRLDRALSDLDIGLTPADLCTGPHAQSPPPVRVCIICGHAEPSVPGQPSRSSG